MSKVTDRLDNKQIVELAKKQYEQEKQNSKFPANIITLPSHGKVYEETSALKSGKIDQQPNEPRTMEGFLNFVQ